MTHKYTNCALLAIPLFAILTTSCLLNTDSRPDVYTAEDRLAYDRQMGFQKSLQKIEEEEIIANTKEVSDGQKKQKK